MLVLAREGAFGMGKILTNAERDALILQGIRHRKENKARRRRHEAARKRWKGKTKRAKLGRRANRK